MASERFRVFWDGVRTTLWLLPLVMVMAGTLLAPAVIALDEGRGGEDRVQGWWLNAGAGEDVRDLLSTLLGDVVSMAAMAFSTSVVAATLAAQQYGPRLVRVFRAGRTTQARLGTFASTIVYLVLVLRTVRGEAAPHEVPHTNPP